MKIKFLPKLSQSKGALILVLSKNNFKGFNLRKELVSQLNKAVLNAKFSFKKMQTLEILDPNDPNFNKVIIMGTGTLNKLSLRDFDLLGGKITQLSLGESKSRVSIIYDSAIKKQDSLLRMAYGSLLGSYKFNKYKTKKKDKTTLPSIYIISNNYNELNKLFQRYSAISEGVFLARDLVNEPSNILYPKEYSRRVLELRKLGIIVEVLGEQKMKSLGMNSLLGVGLGSQHESQLVVMKWNGLKNKKTKPLCFVGKGVCFDSGGISLKPGSKMEEMIGDMGGSAAVVGLMKSLALRKAKANVVGVVGLVENMPDGKAQKPGDIVKSMSGQTIEIQNTDAEGRLVLADALWYTQKRFKPEFIVDLATLTGAILVSLGNVISGIFSNNDKLADKIYKAGQVSGDRVWQLPLDESYDRLIDSQFADMKNIGSGRAGSITAAQFLKRFVNEVPWTHIDIAGTATGMPKNSINTSWATGFGVHLLDTLINQNFES